MAGAIAPVVWLMVLASLLFGAAGFLDGIYPGGPGWSFESYGGLGWTSYAFGVVNLLVALFIARGSERSLTLRIGLAAVFVVERTTTAFFPVPKSPPSVGVHLATALIEAIILTATWRVWRLGHTGVADLSLLTLPQAGGAAVVAGGPSSLAVLPQAVPERAASPRRAGPASALRVRRIPAGTSRVVAVLAFLLAGALVVDALAAGIVPGVTVDLAAPGWLVYLYALAVLVISAFAVSGRRLSLRLLLLVCVILFLERILTPLLAPTSTLDATSLALRAIGALLALALAVVSAAALRAGRASTASATA
jgi:hypothetical protein